MVNDPGARLPGESICAWWSRQMDPVGYGGAIARWVRRRPCPPAPGMAMPLPAGCGVPFPVGVAASTNWFVEGLAVSYLRCAACIECESGACISVESGKPLIVCLPGLARNLVHVRSPNRRWLGDLARNGATRCNGRFPKSVGCSDACEARFADGRSARSSA